MGEFRSIEIDFDIHKRIELERTSFEETPNAVLRRLLNIDNQHSAQDILTSSTGCRPWAGKGIFLPHGTELRMKYNGRVHTGIIHNGEWMVEGSKYKSPSAAAGGVALTKDGKRTNLDGWLYWSVKLPDNGVWVRLSDLRPKRRMLSNLRLIPEQEQTVMTTRYTRHNDLPTENEVIAELESFLGQNPKPVTLPEAYRALADKFDLTPEQRNRIMPNGNEIHWENRVRYARRKLVDAGKIDRTLPRGLWALKKTSI